MAFDLENWINFIACLNLNFFDRLPEEHNCIEYGRRLYQICRGNIWGRVIPILCSLFVKTSMMVGWCLASKPHKNPPIGSISHSLSTPHVLRESLVPDELRTVDQQCNERSCSGRGGLEIYWRMFPPLYANNCTVICEQMCRYVRTVVKRNNPTRVLVLPQYNVTRENEIDYINDFDEKKFEKILLLITQ